MMPRDLQVRELALSRDPAQQRNALIGTVGFFMLFFGVYLTVISPGHQLVPRQHPFPWLPVLLGAAFLTSANLFRLLMRHQHPPRGVLTAATLPTLLLAVALCVILRSPLTAGAAQAVLSAPLHAFDGHHPAELLGKITLMVIIEETIKLLPVMLLITSGIVARPRLAMLLGASAGMSFGMIEAIHHSLFIYGPSGEPTTTYLIRIFIMAPSHGVGAAIACGCMFYVAKARAGTAHATPGMTDALLGMALAVFLHVGHNALQATWGPAVQIATIFCPLALLYALVKGAEKDDAQTTHARPLLA